MTESTGGPIRTFFRFLWQTLNWTRLVIINLVFFLLLFLVLAMLVPPGAGPLPEQGALKVEVAGFLVDQRSYIDPVASLFTQVQGSSGETVVHEVVRAINSGAADGRVTKLILDLQDFAGGDISKLEEIGQALARFKSAGKEVIALSDNYTQNQYYLASYADRVYLHPMGAVLVTGYGAYRNYFKNALDKLKVTMHIFRVGEFKDAVEPFTRSDMSEASEEHNSRWIGELWSAYASGVESHRQLPTGAIDDYVNNLDTHLQGVNGDAAQLALNFRLVDRLANRAEVRRTLIEELGADASGETYAAIDYRAYLTHLDRTPSLSPNNIGLIVASGTIYDGRQPPGNIGGESLAALIREAREVREVKALVLRVDSGGGSAFASEVIRNELVATQNAGIPVIVSMGSVAASGGYWIAANADEIWATPTTLTGSIGVFAVLPTFEDSLDSIGVNTDGVGSTELAGAMRIDRPLSPLAANVLQQNVEYIYRRFINLVAEGRDTNADLIHPIAQGRVWTGAMAQDLGLVDELGYLDDAVAAAAKRIDADSYRVELIQPVLSPWEALLQSLAGGAAKVFSEIEMGPGPASDLRALAQRQWGAITELWRLVNTAGYGEVYAHCLQCTTPTN